MIFAIIPAAGHSVRMGRPKLALPLGGRSVVERVIDSLRQADVAEILVVVGPHVAELARLAEGAGAHALVLPQATPDMRATVEAGLHWLEAKFQPASDDAWLLVPADHPALDVDVVQTLLNAYRKQTACSIAVPTWDGRRGHPAVLAWRHVAGIRTLPPNMGLNVYLRLHGLETLEVPVASDSVLLDLDTPADYDRLQRRFAAAPHSRPPAD